MKILGLETSCDETSAAVIEDGRTVLSCVIASSKNDFAERGGVIPEYAARRQLECILPVIQKALDDAKLGAADIDAIAVTYGPGLLGSLLVGTSTMRILAALWQKPLLPIHHHHGHLDSIWLDLPNAIEVQFPVLTLSVSGGHTEVWLRTSHTEAELIASTRDDAAGEAFDKGALLLGLPYPGGPALAKMADTGDETTHAFPSPLHGQETMDFSFSGLKTSLKYVLRDLGSAADMQHADIAASYQKAICLHLVRRITKALDRYPDVKEVHVVGGVSANTRLRSMLQEHCQSVTVRWPSKLVYCTDNGAMIAAAAYFRHTIEHAETAWRTQASVSLS